jgi:hypothetical protein
MYAKCPATFTSKRKYQVKIRIAVFIALSSIATSALAASNRISNGLIIHSSGEVAIERQNGRIVRPTSGTPIYPGDKLRTAQNAQLMIQCADLGIKSIAPGENQLNSCLLAKEESKSDCSADLVKCPDRGDDKITGIARQFLILSVRGARNCSTASLFCGGIRLLVRLAIS